MSSHQLPPPLAFHAGPVLVAAGGDGNAAVLRAGLLVASQIGRSLVVVSAVDEDALGDARRHRIEQQLAGAGAPFPWSVRIEVGAPPEVLARAVRLLNASVLVMGIGRRRPVDRLLGQETTLRTVRAVDCPVLAVPAGFETLPSVAVVGVDFSDAGRNAAECMPTFVTHDAAVHLIHVWQPTDASDAALVGHDDMYRVSLPDRIHSFSESLRLPDALAVRHEMREGRPAEHLLDAAESHHAGLLVVGRHGKGLFERLLVGSVATRVLRGSPCAVLVVPEPALHARAPQQHPRGVVSVEHERSQWAGQLDAFAGRNAGRLTILEISDVAHVPFSSERGYVLFGVTYREADHEIEIILGEANGRRRHLTRVVADATRLTVQRDDAGNDRALRVEHGAGVTVLALVTAEELAGWPTIDDGLPRRRASDGDLRLASRYSMSAE